MLRKSQNNFQLRHALIFLTTLVIYCEANEIYNLNAVMLLKEREDAFLDEFHD